MNTRELIIANVQDLVADFLYYDRKEDEELGRGDIEKAILEGIIKESEIADIFKKELHSGLELVP